MTAKSKSRRLGLDVPQEVRSLGPWSVISRGEVTELAAKGPGGSNMRSQLL